ncbi:malto-oligosyltrehalose synthase [soil metagenome]
MGDRAVPRSTYRLQLHAGFTFDDAVAVVPYLADLGISHVYCSPYLQAAPGSTHGYDVVDHSRVNIELGGEDGHVRFCAALAEHGLGQVLDIVPNHMAIPGRANGWWWDVLANGPSSPYAGHFDVDWDPPESKLRNTLLMPILGDHYGRVLEAGELRLTFDPAGAELTVRYHDHELPAAPRSVGSIIGLAAARCGSEPLAFIGHSLSRLPPASVTDGPLVHERHRDTEVLRALLVRLCAEEPGVAEAIEAVVAEVTADVDLLDGFLDRQNYRLAFWRTAGRELDYRRFFDINTLVGLRVEDDEVFADTHVRVLQWLADGVLDGVRVDHPDGLLLPAAYFGRLRAAAPEAWVVAEKILEPGETLPPWPIDGTTGYDILNLVTGLFVDPAAEPAMSAHYAAFTGDDTPYEQVLLAAKQQILGDVLAADLSRLTNLAVAVCERHRRYRDHTRHDLADVLREIVVAFDVYRTYVDRSGPSGPQDEIRVGRAVALAGERRPDLDPDLLDFLQRLLLGTSADPDETELRLRFQQLTGPVMAKAAEDTAFYRYHRLTALNEVGGDPGRVGVPVAEFHERCTALAREWPGTMTALSTHDTKRSEDVRARLAVLSELTTEWGAAVRRWHDLTARHRADGFPEPATEELIFQTLVGAWPLSVERALAYLEKATKEAKVHTSWVDPVPAYDEAVRSYLEGALVDDDFVAEVDDFAAGLIGPGAVNALAQKLVQLTMPGVPDLYQGSELWDLSLVDPDNRRPVDFDERRRLLTAITGLGPAGLDKIVARAEEGLPKLWLVARALDARRRHPRSFAPGSSYEPLLAVGSCADHVVAFRRDELITVVPRLPVTLARAGGWGDTALALPEGPWSNLLTGEDVGDGPVMRLRELFERFPVALLEIR